MAKRYFSILICLILAAFIFAAAPISCCADDVAFYSDEEDAVAELREAMKARSGSISVGVLGSADEESLKDEIGRLILLAQEHTGKADEGDSLMFQMGGYRGEGHTLMHDGSPAVQIDYSITYYDDADQEKELEEKTAEILSELAPDDKSDYEKISAIHDYICENVEYEKADEDGSERTAYDALVRGKATCQGYSVALYRLLLAAGIDNRIIFGEGMESDDISGAHTWNIVKLGDEYYYIDVTWDDTTESRDYFLKGSGEFEDTHKRGQDYETDYFTENYPIAETDYIVEKPGILERLKAAFEAFWELIILIVS